MALVIVDLISRKEKQVRLDPLDVLHQIILGDVTPMPRVNGISRESHRNELPFIDGILAYHPLIGSFPAMSYAIGRCNGIIPILHPEGAVQPRSIKFVRATSVHFALTLCLQDGFSAFSLKQRIELSRKLESLFMNRVKSKANDLITSDLGNCEGINPFGLSKGRNGQQMEKTAPRQRDWIEFNDFM